MTKNYGFAPSSIDTLTSGSLRDPETIGLRVETQPSGRKIWKYERRMARTRVLVRLTLGTFPKMAIPAARECAKALNDKIDEGIDPREELRAKEDRASMTVAKAHELYMAAVHEGRASRAKRKNKPRTISDKQRIYDRDISSQLKRKSIHEVTEKDLIDLVSKKGRVAKVRANRLAAELKVFFGWAASLRGLEIGLEADPSLRLGDLRYPEAPRDRKLSLEEIEWYLKAIAEEEERDYRRGMILMLLTAARISELIRARADEREGNEWTIPAGRSKNRTAHTIRLGPWGQKLMETNSEWVFLAPRAGGPRIWGWYPARDRVLARMAKYAGRKIDHFVPHDCRRTARSNTKRLKVDFETAEAMLNHVKSGLERIYDGYELEDEKAAWFLKWEDEIVRLAHKAGVADKLEVPAALTSPDDREAG